MILLRCTVLAPVLTGPVEILQRTRVRRSALLITVRP
ncbi:hypothetical protein M6B38_163500 [Iris pallida]|uniref:Uncharacterized protein n=1 Tax=Iris pallida TaxID=29817 RepID=A0AAX6EYH9_IRIPA|nr:hypothetical protein M6B38_163500 [Iris pallida]